jgi:hypothetical protein
MSGTEQRLTFRLLSYWNRIRGTREFPSLADVNIAEISEIYHLTFTIALSPDGDHSFHYFGPELAGIVGEDVTGHLLEEAFNGTMLGNLVGFYDKVVAQRAPVSESSQFFMEGKEIRYRSLIVPLSSNGTDIDYLFGTTNYKAYD